MKPDRLTFALEIYADVSICSPSRLTRLVHDNDSFKYFSLLNTLQSSQFGMLTCIAEKRTKTKPLLLIYY